MLDVRLTRYISPVAEQVLDDLPCTVELYNAGDETGIITGLVRVYRFSLSGLLFSSELPLSSITPGQTIELTALTLFSPPAPADADYFILCDCDAVSATSQARTRFNLGSYTFDIKPGPMGPAPAAHGGTHEDGGMDEISVQGLSGQLADAQPVAAHVATHMAGGPDELNVTNLDGVLADPQPPQNHHANHEDGGSDELEVSDLATSELDDTLVLHPDGAGGVEWAVGAPVILSETPQTLVDQANIDWDLSLGGAATVTLAGNRNMNAPSNVVNGSHMSLRVIQDGTGTRTLTWDAAYYFPGDVSPTLTATAGASDMLLFYCDGSHLLLVGGTFDVR